MGYLRNITVAISLASPILRDRDCVELLKSLMEQDRIEDIVVLATQQSFRREEDSEKKRELISQLDGWLQRHVVWPIWHERYSDEEFIRRAAHAYDISFIMDTRKFADIASKVRRKIKFLRVFEVDEKRLLDGVTRTLGKLSKNNRRVPAATALEKVC